MIIKMHNIFVGNRYNTTMEYFTANVRYNACVIKRMSIRESINRNGVKYPNEKVCLHVPGGQR